MPSIDERVAYLEGKVEDHYGAMAGFRTDLREVRVEVREVRGEIGDLRTEMNQRFEVISAQSDSLGAKVDTNFTWLVGTQVAMIIALIGALLRQ